MGDLTSVPIPANLNTGGLAAVQGRVVADTISTTHRTTLNTGTYTQWRYTIEVGSPLVATDTVQCRPYDETDVVLDGYSTLPTLTMTAPVAGGVQNWGACCGEGCSNEALRTAWLALVLVWLMASPSGAGQPLPDLTIEVISPPQSVVAGGMMSIFYLVQNVGVGEPSPQPSSPDWGRSWWAQAPSRM